MYLVKFNIARRRATTTNNDALESLCFSYHVSREASLLALLSLLSASSSKTRFREFEIEPVFHSISDRRRRERVVINARRREWKQRKRERERKENSRGGRCTAVTRPTAVSAGRPFSLFLSLSLRICVRMCAARVYRYVRRCLLSFIFLSPVAPVSLFSLLQRFRRPSD